MSAAADFFTIARSPYRRLAKLIHADGSAEDYSRAKHFDLAACPVRNLDHLLRRLTVLIRRPDLCVVRGAIVDPDRANHVRRLLHAKPDGEQTLQEAPHYWIALDVDGTFRPDDVPASDLLACARHAIDLLPGEFRGARCIIQATAGHGIKPGSRLRLWYWSSRILDGRELSTWLRRSPVDNSLFSAAQIHYTSGPVFAFGIKDHLPVRLAELPGTATVTPPSAEELAPPPPVYAAPVTPKTADRQIQRIITDQLFRVRSASEGARHNTLRAAAYCIGGLLDDAGISQSQAKDALVAAIRDGAGAASAIKDADTIESGLEAGRKQPMRMGGACV